MAASWSTVCEWSAQQHLTRLQFNELEAAGLAPDTVKCGGLKVVTTEAAERWEQAYGWQVINALFHPAQSSVDEAGNGET